MGFRDLDFRGCRDFVPPSFHGTLRGGPAKTAASRKGIV